MKKRLAIITGATSGIGACFANTLAEAGWQLLISGRRQDRLLELSRNLMIKYGTMVDYVVADLSQVDDLNRLLSKINEKKNVELLVNNAGFGCSKDFFISEFQIHQNMLQVHVVAATQIIRQVVPKMIEQKQGTIINVASLSAFFPSPVSYYYCSSKAFLVTFSECLQLDLLNTNIKVQALCPGFTKTEFHTNIAALQPSVRMKSNLLWMEAEKVVAYSLNHLKSERVICVPGMFNRTAYHLMRFIPRQLFYKLLTRVCNATKEQVSFAV
jgi:short-subunit dehydrogenase